MKNKYFLIAIFSLLCLASFGQTIGKLYKSDHWADVKGVGYWAKAVDNPIYENVEILKTDKNIKVTFGSKVYNYAIISYKENGQLMVDYTVTLNGKTYVITVGQMLDGTTTISASSPASVNCDIWMVTNISDISIVSF